MVVYAFNASTQKVEAGGSQVPGNLDYIERSYLKEPKKGMARARAQMIEHLSCKHKALKKNGFCFFLFFLISFIHVHTMFGSFLPLVFAFPLFLLFFFNSHMHTYWVISHTLQKNVFN
jgi:hypothetical protein